MALEYYDDVIAAKIARWLPSTDKIRVLKPDETRRLFELNAHDKNDEPLQLPLLSLSRNNEIELLLNLKNPRSFAGLTLLKTKDSTVLLDAIPIRLVYQLDIYTKNATDGDAYLRQYLFKLINNPSIKICIPYNGTDIEQIANIRVLNNVADTSAIAERLFPGQFTRWSIQFEVQDAFLYDVPYRKNWKLYVPDSKKEFWELINENEASELILQNDTDEKECIEHLPFNWKK